MLIQCTKKLLDELGVTPVSQIEEDPLFSWHANLLKVGRKKTVVLVNDRNLYAIVLHGLKAKDMKTIGKLIVQAIRETFEAECIKDEVIEQFLQHSPHIAFSKTKDRTSVARMNKACENVYYFGKLLDNDSINQVEMNLRINGLLAGVGKNDYIYPKEEKYKHLEELAGQPIFQSEAVELKVKLMLERREVWRKIVVPTNTTFPKLHRILQIVFHWKNRHLYDFYIYPINTDGKVIAINQDRPIVNLVCDEEAFHYQGDVPMKMDTGIKLSEYLPAKIVYNYDFGDSWQHTIEVVRVIENFDLNYPICIDGEGAAPPEDVGGEQGYKAFLLITSDKNHQDYEHMLEWGMRQGYREFDKEEINRSLRRV
ncbi:plasmid pRiA4b ORF-3 family protein [Metabacillus arenae]|uniref:Plasmid pRiA4b ORF-3 family protein n=1 Tax=Metabacillus arenae TaxID=2771434 RepID=A0A926NQJ7_9BACI|nr:plasmid pRiA4b ORF-3 family protein [Metabacillus arenae]MBD1382197.1 plasmid pRiA4b ORF-3 family protein [Metabacillus arenae]